jgi:hypothetical protein
MDDRNVQVPGAVPVDQVLASDPLYRILGSRLTSPWVLGVVVACLIAIAVVLGPSTDSHFIYTDF